MPLCSLDTLPKQVDHMGNTFVDSHCHVHSVGPDSEAHSRAKWEELGLSPEAIVDRAVQANVVKLICVGTDVTDSIKAVEFAQENEHCYAAIGIHPHEAKRYLKDTAALKQLSDLARQPKVVAIGECGLDYFYNHSEPNDQAAILRFQLDLAQEHNLPVIFHVREAFDDFWPIFNSYQDSLKGVLHSFTDTPKTLQTALDKGLYIGVNGITTFPSATALREMVKAVSSERLLLETDAPYLTPTPYRGNINEPKQIVRIAEFLVELRHTTLDQLADTTTVNANRLFGL